MQNSVQKIFFQKSLWYSFLEVALKSRCGGKKIKNKYYKKCFKVVEIWVFLFFLFLYIFQVFYNVCTINNVSKNHKN